jgi:hypothetical protein
MEYTIPCPKCTVNYINLDTSKKVKKDGINEEKKDIKIAIVKRRDKRKEKGYLCWPQFFLSCSTQFHGKRSALSLHRRCRQCKACVFNCHKEH